MTPAKAAGVTTLTIPVSQVEQGDRLQGYPGQVKRAYEHKGILGKFPIIKLDNGMQIFPKSMDSLVTVERENGGDA